MNRTTTWIFICAIVAVSLLEVALAVLNLKHHGGLLFAVGPAILALGLGLQALGAYLRRDKRPAPPADDGPRSRRLAGPGRTFRRR